MKHEIIFEKLPSGRFYAKQLVVLRSFIEHKLLANVDTIWDYESDDPTWQAICRYYSLIIRAQVNTDAVFSHLRPAMMSVGAGAIIAGLEYPTIWRMCIQSESLQSPFIAFAAGCQSLSPSIVMTMIADSVKAHGFPCSGGRISLGLEGLRRHLGSTTPGAGLRLTTKMDAWVNTTLCLDDGQFVSGLCPSTEMSAANAIPEVDEVQKRLFARWLRDSVLGIGLRDVIAPDGGVSIKAVEKMAEMLQYMPLTSENVYLILSAIADRIWDPEMLQPLTAALLTEPTAINDLTRKLPENLKLVLPPEIDAYRP